MRRKSTRHASKGSPEKVREVETAPKARRLRRRKRSPSKSSDSEDEDPKPTPTAEEVPDTTTQSHSPSDEDASSQEPMWKVTSSDATPKGEIRKLKICLTRPSPDKSPEKSKARRSKSGSHTEDDATTSSEDKSSTSRQTRSRGSSFDVEEKKGKGKSKGKHKSKIEQSSQHIHENNEMQTMNNEISENAQVTPQSPSIDKPVDNENVCNTDDIQCINEEIMAGAGDGSRDRDQIGSNANSHGSKPNLEDVALDTSQGDTQNQSANQNYNDNTDTEIVYDASAEAQKVPDAQNHSIEEDSLSAIQTYIIETSELPRQVQDNTEKEVSYETQCDSVVAETASEETVAATEEDNQTAQPLVEEDTVQSPVRKKTQPSDKEETGPPKETQLPVQEDAEQLPVGEEALSPKTEETRSSAKAEEQPATVDDDVAEASKESSTKESPPDDKNEEIESSSVAEKLTEPKSGPSVSDAEKLTEPKSGPSVSDKMDEGASTSRVSQEESLPGDSEEPSESSPFRRLKRISSLPEGQTQPRSRQWSVTEELASSVVKIDLETLQSFCPTIEFPEEPDLKVVEPPKERRASQTETATKVVERKVSIEYSKRESPEKIVQETVDNSNIIAFNRKISIVDDTASKLRPPPSPAQNPTSDVLYITNLVRPFTLKQLKELLERTGKIKGEGFWTDRIKSKCYVVYETVEEAEATRNALHGVQWPIGNGKKLMIDYATVEDLEKAKNPPPPPPVVVLPPPEPKVPAKENVEHVEVKPRNEEKKSRETDRADNKRRIDGPVREWDIGKKDFRRDRSRSRDRGRKHRRTPSPHEDFITKKQKKQEEATPQKLMDDLFLKTKATPSIYWQPLSPEEISTKQQQRLIRMEEHKRRMEESSRIRGRDAGRGAFRRRYD